MTEQFSSLKTHPRKPNKDNANFKKEFSSTNPEQQVAYGQRIIDSNESSTIEQLKGSILAFAEEDTTETRSRLSRFVRLLADTVIQRLPSEKAETVRALQQALANDHAAIRSLASQQAMYDGGIEGTSGPEADPSHTIAYRLMQAYAELNSIDAYEGVEDSVRKPWTAPRINGYDAHAYMFSLLRGIAEWSYEGKPVKSWVTAAELQNAWNASTELLPDRQVVPPSEQEVIAWLREMFDARENPLTLLDVQKWVQRLSEQAQVGAVAAEYGITNPDDLRMQLAALQEASSSQPKTLFGFSDDE